MDSSKDHESSSSESQQMDVSKRLQLGGLDTNRILITLALLGVLLPMNAIVGRYRNFGFTYHAQHDWILKGPYHVRATVFFDVMQFALALAVYLYAFDFVFRRPIFQRAGDILYAVALLVPLTFVSLSLYVLFYDAIEELNTPLFWVTSIFSRVVFFLSAPLIVALVGLIVNRLQGGDYDPFSEARKKYEEERKRRSGAET